MTSRLPLHASEMRTSYAAGSPRISARWALTKGVDRLVGAERLQPAGHRGGRHEGSRGEDEQEHHRQRCRLVRFRVADPQAEHRETPGERVLRTRPLGRALRTGWWERIASIAA